MSPLHPHSVSGFSRRLVQAAVCTLFANPVLAARIGELDDLGAWSQAQRFLSFEDPTVRMAVMGAVALGVVCGLMGSFIVVRRMALVGDTLSHAVLPGIALGFLWNMEKDPLTLVIGAVLAGFIGVWLVNAIRSTTHIREDSALGMILSGFYAIGVCLLTMIQRLPTAEKSGLNHFLFGSAAALGSEDVLLIGVIAGVSILFVVVLFRGLLVTSFDAGFSRAIGMPYRWIEYLLYTLVTFAIVVSLKAVGVVLISALLIIPPATAYLLTDRFERMLLLAVGFGMLSAVAGTFISFLGNDMPTGPFMVVSASFLFAGAFTLGPRYGWLPRLWRRLERRRRVARENLLRSFYQALEEQEFANRSLRLSDLSRHRGEPLEATARILSRLEQMDLVQKVADDEDVPLPGTRSYALTNPGWVEATRIVRNHRLWELYLTSAASYPADHVHEDADRVEHVLGEDVVRRIEKRLNHPRFDPHGRPIPHLDDLPPGYARPPAGKGGES